MGRYHHPVCIEAEEGLSPSAMDAGAKEGEQGFSPRPAKRYRRSRLRHAAATCPRTAPSRR